MTYKELTTEQLLEYVDRSDPEVDELACRLERSIEVITLCGENAKEVIDEVTTYEHEQNNF